jgi:hypothetical protein
MCGLSTPEHNAAVSTGKTQNATINYANSTATARDKATLCKQFLTMAQYIRTSSESALRSAGQHPNHDDRDDLSAMRQQWQELLGNQLLAGAGEVLTEAFSEDAKLQMSKLDEASEVTTRAREAWQEVVSLVQQCKSLNEEVEQVMAKIWSLFSDSSRDSFP